MLTVEAALAHILKEVTPFSCAHLPIRETLGLTLAEDVRSDIDSPPFDKSLMDGFAIRAEDLADGSATLDVIEEVTAGIVPQKQVGLGQATQIMTGAPLPKGADTVVRVEDSSLDADGTWVTLRVDSLAKGTAVLLRGASMRCGDCIVPAGTALTPQILGSLAEAGQGELAVRRRPRVAILTTGDELVPVEQRPGPGQIRNSNEVMLSAQVERAGGVPVPLGIARDERADLGAKIRGGLDADVLLLSGGVSAGKLDLVPSELQAAGVRQVFHKIRMKPGKPLWFGTHHDEQTDQHCWVFGLPGNPVSSMVCFELFVRTAVRRLMGVLREQPCVSRAALTVEHSMRSDRPVYHPARLHSKGARLVVAPLQWRGSADLRATVDANALIHFPAGDRTYPAEQTVDVIRL